MKKSIAFLLVLFVFVSLFAACGKTSKPSVDEPEKITQDDKEPVDYLKGSNFKGYPIEGGGKLSLWSHVLPLHKDYIDPSESPWHNWISEFSGIDIEWLRPAPGANAQQELNLMLASDDLPDIIFANQWYNKVEELVAEGTVISLNNYFKDYAPFCYEAIKDRPLVDKGVQTSTGDYFCFPFISEDLPRQRTYQGHLIREDFLKELNLKLPETIDDWDTMLKGFKTLCEVPFSTNSGFHLLRAFSNPFDFHHDFFIKDDGSIGIYYNAEHYYDFLVLMNNWYKSGLIEPELATINSQGFLSRMAAEPVGAVYCGSLTPGNFKDSLEARGDKMTYVGASYVIGEFNSELKYIPGTSGWETIDGVITKACKNIPLACRFLDYGYTEEGILTWNFGKEGESYKIVNGKPEYTDLVWEQAAVEGRAEAMKRYTAMTDGTPSIQLLSMYQQRNLPEVTEYTEAWIKNSEKSLNYRFPTMTVGLEETNELSNLTTGLTTYAQEMYFAFIIGNEDLSGYDNYLKQLKALKVDRVLEIKEQQYKRFMAR